MLELRCNLIGPESDHDVSWIQGRMVMELFIDNYDVRHPSPCTVGSPGKIVDARRSSGGVFGQTQVHKPGYSKLK